MTSSPLKLLILDENKLVAEPLKDYLNSEFGSRISISLFFDEDNCVKSIDENSHVIVLNYFLNEEDNAIEKGLKRFNSIREKKPKAQVVMLTSKIKGTGAVEEFHKIASKYIVRKEYYQKRRWLLLNRLVLSPIYTLTISPVRKRIEEYTLQDYLVMFIVAFVSVGSLVVLFLKLSS